MQEIVLNKVGEISRINKTNKEQYAFQFVKHMDSKTLELLKLNEFNLEKYG